jgi:hypothetical protein
LAKTPKKAPVDYIAKIGASGWPELAKLWALIEAVPRKPITGWAAGKALEHLVLRAFELSGAEVIWPYSVNLQGTLVEQIDGMVLLDGLTIMVETKDQACER